MSIIQTIFWGAILIASLAISTYQLITTGTLDSTHLLAALISMAVIDILRAKPTSKPIFAYKKGTLSPANEAKLLAGESFAFGGSPSDIIKLT